MTDFANASMIQRRLMLEDALAGVLSDILEITTYEGERCVALASPTDGDDWQFHPLWEMACRLEGKLA